MIHNIPTSNPLVFRFDNVLSKEECFFIKEYIDKNTNDQTNSLDNTRPWHNHQNIFYQNIDNFQVKTLVSSCNYIVSNLISHHYNELTYPTFTDLVKWVEGKDMPLHVDDGNGEVEHLKNRMFSSVIYLNDDYEGGETIIKSDKDYISIPKIGTCIIFKSDKSCLHGVNKVLKGKRFTLASWYTKNKHDLEI